MSGSIKLKKIALPALLGLVILANIFLFLKNPTDLDRLLINIMLALSAFVTLHARLLSLASAGFMAIGAYGSAIAVAKLGLPFFMSLPLAIVLCGLLALLIGLPVLRLNDVYLAIATLGFGEVVRILIVLNPDWTGGPTGANLSTGFAYETMKQVQTWMILVFGAFLVVFFARMARSKVGRAFRALRENQSAASTMGISVVQYKSLAFVLSAMIAGAAGAFYAHSVGSLDNGDFKFTRAVDILSYAVLGGSGHWMGPILGAGVLTALPIFLRDTLGGSIDFFKNFVQLPNIVNGLALMLTIVFLPGGLASLGNAFRRQRLNGHLPEIEKKSQTTISKDNQKSADILVLEDVTKSFGGLSAVSQVSISFAQGQISGLIGPNGAGKTTLVNLVSGLLHPTSGKIIWKGKEIHRRSSDRIARLGIARTYQNIQLFEEMTVLDNVVVGRHSRIHTNLLTTLFLWGREKREELQARSAALSLLQRLGLGEVAEVPAGQLSYGDQRRVEIARALAQEPELLLLDEPAAGMNDVETRKLGEFIVDLRNQGYSLVVIEHHMDLIMRVCDTICVLNFGRKIAEGSPEIVKKDDEVREAYLGRD